MAKHKKAFAAQSDSHPQDFHGGRRELTSTCCSLIFVYNTHTHTRLSLNLTNEKKKKQKTFLLLKTG